MSAVSDFLNKLWVGNGPIIPHCVGAPLPRIKEQPITIEADCYLSINQYRTVQNSTDTQQQLSIRAVRSILMYCQDWGDKSLHKNQRMQSLVAGQTLCEAVVGALNTDLPVAEYGLMLSIFTNTAKDFAMCQFDGTKSLVENERALIKLLDILVQK